ncbi:MAG: hypothetical protein HS113_18395 [Verrucomicrobiales bacterium]|nr:hypothetical protein [Verrucomicrobiales bacterium]
MNQNISAELDPFRVVVSSASETNNADQFIEVFARAGLMFDMALTAGSDYSHSTRIRALRPRVLAAYDQLSPEGRLAAANAALGGFVLIRPNLREPIMAALRKIGWAFLDDTLVAVDPPIREMFFPRDSRWDAFVTVRDFMARAAQDILVVDPYCDHTVFGLLRSSGPRPLNIRLLCRNNHAALKAEAEVFHSQYPDIVVELRKSADFHDRFVIIDRTTCVHIGASLNHAGSRAFMISTVEDARNRIALLEALGEAWEAGTPE